MGQKNTPWEEAAQLLGTWGGMGMLSQASRVPALGGNQHSEPSAATVRHRSQELAQGHVIKLGLNQWPTQART